MTQDRRKDDKLPEGPLVFTDRNLTAAGLAHLEAEKAAACLVHAKDDVWVGVGTKGALRGLLSEDTASQSQAVPSELASQLREYAANSGYSHNDYADTMREAADIIEKMGPTSTTNISVPPPPPAPPTRYVCDSVKPTIKTNAQRASHSIDTPEFRQLVAKVWQMPTIGGRDKKIKPLIDYINRHIASLASPAAPLAGKAEEVCPSCKGYCEGVGADGVENDCHACFVREHLAGSSAPLAAAVPAEEAKSHRWDDEGERCMDCGDKDWFAGSVCTPRAPAEPAPIQASALTDERLAELFEQACAHPLEDDDWAGVRALAHTIEREVLARLSTPTAPVAADAAVRAPSIDTDEFWQVMDTWRFASPGLAALDAAEAVVSFIDRHIATHAHAPAGRDAILEEAAKACEDEATKQSVIHCLRTAEVAHSDSAHFCAERIRALKSHAAEQASGGAK